MKNLNLLIVEGNLREENQGFIDGGIKTHTESLKDSISHFTENLDIDVAIFLLSLIISPRLFSLKSFSDFLTNSLGAKPNLLDSDITSVTLSGFLRYSTKSKLILFSLRSDTASLLFPHLGL